MNAKISETDLFYPIKEYLESNGYSVNAEVASCDIVASKDNEVTVIELKTTFSLALVFQVVERLKITDSVYAAFAAPLDRDYPKNIKKIMLLLRRLEVGLIVVHMLKYKSRVEVVFHPGPYEKRKNRNRQLSIIREIAGRKIDNNIGGSTSSSKKITLYRQKAIQVAVYLNFLKQASPALLVKYGCSKKTSTILNLNHYGWFEKIERGVYTLHSAGKKALKNYSELVEIYSKEYRETKKKISENS
ncbi:MAG: hypothetical protein JXR90_11955 [Spirochaetes bacterium]|nr:hypothetical protein [Spirochaetota bacterium]